VLAHLSKANSHERLGNFKQAFEELDTGERLLKESFGHAHPLLGDFDQARRYTTEQLKYSHGANWDEPDYQGADGRSELMKKGRVKRTYL